MTTTTPQRTTTPRRHHRNDTTLKPTTCPGCRRQLLTGLDSPNIATDITLDPTPLPTPAMEYAALLLGRNTYQLHGDPTHSFEATHRATPTGRIPNILDPASKTVVVIPTHDCGKPFITPRMRITRPPIIDLSALDNSKPPF